ncbi:hypothetical protein REJC140_03997 [Pseudorhizobium endolithicum]|uniref:Uncharacterized protein n=1 Tax=Pseudorhizobium endolithicum TaxID=1191678 RepID=A0ABM8PSA2_9HYPH|nr:hypothetical protein REJC140_03997 [Pseudorhizobium endolithicum]
MPVCRSRDVLLRSAATTNRGAFVVSVVMLGWLEKIMART